MSVEDKLAIQQAIAWYAYTFDSGDAEGWANVFTKDGVWEFYAPGATTSSVRLVGHDELRAFAERQYRNRPPGLTSLHHQSGLYFDEVTQESASTRAMVIITTQTAGEPASRLYTTGVYDDKWQKTPKGWRLIYRALKA